MDTAAFTSKMIKILKEESSNLDLEYQKLVRFIMLNFSCKMSERQIRNKMRKQKKTVTVLH